MNSIKWKVTQVQLWGLSVSNASVVAGLVKNGGATVGPSSAVWIGWVSGAWILGSDWLKFCGKFGVSGGGGVEGTRLWLELVGVFGCDGCGDDTVGGAISWSNLEFMVANNSLISRISESNFASKHSSLFSNWKMVMPLLALIPNCYKSWVELTLENWLARGGCPRAYIHVWLILYLSHVRHLQIVINY